MTTTQYLNALKQLGLTPYGKATRQALGLSQSAIARMAAGGPVNETVAILLQMYIRAWLIENRNKHGRGVS